ncbi:MAG TPA: glycerol-3-phosphate 1-O-acyltransferase PlsB [Steroidobacteraceae bacterium]|jgi:glycerol-3-phosphate O-acyltransferase|nr:glycerol-3-phosphate 1-O-acyltransferase PlsB [Steroidobacteraceae bacterium]
MRGLLRRILALWVRVTLRPENAAARMTGLKSPICYVLERASSSELAVLQNMCLRERLPGPKRRLLARQLKGARSSFALTHSVGFWRHRDDRRPPVLLRSLIDLLRQDASVDVNLVPTSVYWGRAPSRERSMIRLLLSEDWVIASRLRRAFTVLFNGRNTTVQLGDPISLRSLLGSDSDTAVTARRVSRQLRQQLSRQRTSRIGPDLSHRRTIVNGVLRTRAVRAAVAQEVRDKGKKTRRALLLEARGFANEIAANYSHVFVSVLAIVLAKLWNRLYDGVEFQHVDTLQQVAQDNEIIYVPCHRSHMDYLLLSYAIYQHGYALPHIAAGLNLNLPVVGRFLRKGGAFFLRRTLRGSTLYTIVFMKYLAAIMARGHSIEYFIEGGRSRTGRLRPPMTGMLAMTVRSYLREPRRPVVFVPVYFGYERIVEGTTYVGELSGRPKEKESVLGLLRTLGKLRQRFGRVHVNLGEPIRLDQSIERYLPQWRDYEYNDQERPPWVNTLVDELAQNIMRRINAAASLTPINLLALVLLATPRQSMLVPDLTGQINIMLAILKAVPYSDRVTLTAQSAPEIIQYGVDLKVITLESHRAGDIVRMSPEHAVLATYYRNNVLHLFAMPSLIACCFLSNAAMRTDDVRRLASRIYPYIAEELFLRWSEDELNAVVAQILSALADLGLLESDGDIWRRPPPTSAAAMQLSLLAQNTIQTIERYYLVIALLIRTGSGVLTQKKLEDSCQLMAQRMTMLHGLNSPEFFDPSLFESFIDLLRNREVIRTDQEGRLMFDDVLMRVEADAQVVLSEQIRHSILQVTHG